MLEGTRRWFRRNRSTFAIGAGALGVVYIAGQYAWSKWLEARQRMAEERIAKEKCVSVYIPSGLRRYPLADYDAAFAAASNKIRRIAHTPSSPSCQL